MSSANAAASKCGYRQSTVGVARIMQKPRRSGATKLSAFAGDTVVIAIQPGAIQGIAYWDIVNSQRCCMFIAVSDVGNLRLLRLSLRLRANSHLAPLLRLVRVIPVNPIVGRVAGPNRVAQVIDHGRLRHRYRRCRYCRHWRRATLLILEREIAADPFLIVSALSVNETAIVNLSFGACHRLRY